MRRSYVLATDEFICKCTANEMFAVHLQSCPPQFGGANKMFTLHSFLA